MRDAEVGCAAPRGLDVRHNTAGGVLHSNNFGVNLPHFAFPALRTVRTATMLFFMIVSRASCASAYAAENVRMHTSVFREQRLTLLLMILVKHCRLAVG